jgi:hypothetical protein
MEINSYMLFKYVSFPTHVKGHRGSRNASCLAGRPQRILHGTDARAQHIDVIVDPDDATRDELC